MTVAVGRIGGLVAPLAAAYVAENTGDGKNILGVLLLIMAFFLVTVIAAIPWAIWGKEGNGVSLEEACGEVVNVQVKDKV